MLGRGIISNPGLLDRIAAGRNSGGPGTDKETLKRFHQMIYEGYRQIMSGDRNVLFKMKEMCIRDRNKEIPETGRVRDSGSCCIPGPGYPGGCRIPHVLMAVSGTFCF